MICFKCHQEIKSEEDYYCIGEYSKGKLVDENYTHKKCWDNFLNKLMDVSEAQGIIRSMKKRLTSLGMLEPEEVIIK
jgi:hypothetical protein